MKILMIHEIYDDIFTINFEKYDILTFDDGLYSVLLNFDKFPKDKRKIIFVSGDIIRESNVAPIEFIECYNAHDLYRQKNNKSAYLSLEELEFLKSEGFEIGGHGFKHLRCNKFTEIKDEVDKCLEILPDIKSYCLPYNQINPLYNTYLKYKKLEIFGYGRIDANLLVNKNYKYFNTIKE